ncbi:MAG: hypothetical protein K6A64_00870 [Bacteroidales bacterium]|nr:hypothetical protein [Bacteroidales bacterium]
MKKYLFLLAFGALTLAACHKEKEVDTPTPVATTITLSASGEAFGLDLKGSTTKGTLDVDGNFLWADGDQIGVRLYKGTTYNGKWTYGNDSYDAWDATFALESGAGKAKGTFTSTTTINDGYVNWGYAAFFPRFSNNVSNNDGKVYFELKKVYENYTSNTCLMPMVAYPGGGNLETRPTDISFKHVGAGVRVTLKDVPANANQASLTVAGKNIANGDNYTNWFGVNPANAGTDAIAATDGNGENTVYLQFATASDKRDITFIFPLPTVDLSGGITIKLYYGSEHTEFWSKTAHPTNPALPTLGRGDLLDMPDLTVGDWKKLGVGKFIDNQLWATMDFVDYTSDEVGFVDVVIEQNIVDNTKYRIRNPYGQASTYLALLGLTQGDHSDYLNFTIASNGAVTFDDCVTGFVKGGVNYSIKQTVDGSTAKDHLVLGDYTSPSVVEIAPDYYDGSLSTRQMTRNDHTNAVRIIFPSIVNSATGSTTLTGNAYFGSGMTYTNNAAKMSVFVSSKSLFEYYNARWDNNETCYSGSIAVGTKSTNKTASTGNLTAGNLGVNTSFFTTSGILYLYWYTYTSDGTLLMEGCRRFYYLIPTDGTALTKTFTAPTSAECKAAGSTRTPDFYFNSTYFSKPSVYSMTLAVSDDLTKGNVMVTNFAGVSGKAYGYYNASATFFTLFINEPFCNVSGTDFYLREYYPNVGTSDGQDYRGTARFKLNGTYYGGVNNGIACWGGYFGLYTGKNTGEGGTCGISVAPFFNIE